MIPDLPVVVDGYEGGYDEVSTEKGDNDCSRIRIIKVVPLDADERARPYYGTLNFYWGTEEADDKSFEVLLIERLSF